MGPPHGDVQLVARREGGEIRGRHTNVLAAARERGLVEEGVGQGDVRRIPEW